MGAILTATSIPGVFIPVIGIPHADKVVHLCMYGTLGFLLARAIDNAAGTARIRGFLGAFLFCTVMGAADEWHQLYIPGRTAEVADWMADSIGGLAGAAAWAIRSRHKAIRIA